MRSFEIILLKFITPVHFGDAAEGGGLGTVLSYARADTFFSALCREAADISPELLAWLIGKANDGEIQISDLLPWKKCMPCYQLYIPRPMMPLPQAEGSETEILSFEEVQEKSQERKQLKKRAFIRAGDIEKYLHNETIEKEPVFGEKILRAQFNGRENMPYHVAAYQFDENAGLYIIVSGEETDLAKINRLISLTGLSGIGGKRSSGYGKYTFEDDPLILSTDDIYGGDDSALYQMLIAENAACYMALSSFLPGKTEVEFVGDGTGKIVKRGGFAWSRQMKEPFKTNTVYMMGAGSCFSKRLEGRMADVNNGSSPHPVYKYGKGLFAGLPL